MLRHTLMVIIAAGLLLAAGWFLIPQGQERALINLKDGDFKLALQGYEAAYAAGDRSPVLLAKLSEVYLDLSNVPAANRIVSEMLRRYPSEAGVLRRASAFFADTQQPSRLAEMLESKLDSATEKDLIILADRYALLGDNKNLVRILEHQMSRGFIGPSQTMTLAVLSLHQGKPDEARKLLSIVLGNKRSPDVVRVEARFLLAHVLLDSGDTNAVISVVQDGMGSDSTPEDIANLIESLFAQGIITEISPVVELFLDKVELTPRLQALGIDAMTRTGRTKQALDRLRAWRSKGPLPFELQSRMIDVAIFLGDHQSVLEVIKNVEPLHGLPPETLINLVTYVTRLGTPTNVEEIASRLPAQFLKTHPEIDAHLSLARGDRDRASEMVASAAMTIDSMDQRLRIADIFIRLGQQGHALDILAAPADLSAASGPYLTQLGLLYWSNGQAKEGLARLEELKNSVQDHRADIGWLILAARMGHSEAVKQWMLSARDLDALILRDVATAAVASGDTKLGLLLAESLYRQAPSPESRYLYAEALVRDGQVNLARPEVEALLPGNDAVQSLYLQVLNIIGDKPALQKYWLSVLQSSALTQSEHDQAIFDLLNAEGEKDAMPYIRERANTNEDNWVFLYADVARKTGQTRALAAFLTEQLQRKMTQATLVSRLSLLVETAPDHAKDVLKKPAISKGGVWADAYQAALRGPSDNKQMSAFLIARAAQAGASSEEKRNAAQQLLALGRKNDAVSIYLKLADKLPDSADMQQVAFLWGPRPGAKAIEWLAGQVIAAKGDSRKKWIARLSDHGGAAELVKLVEKGQVSPEEGGVHYLSALSTAGRVDALDRELRAALARPGSDPSAIASLAEQWGRRDVALQAWASVVQRNADNPSAHRGLAYAFLDNSRFTDAVRHFQKFFEKASGDYSDRFAYAEALNATREQTAAQVEYRAAEKLINDIKAPTYRDRMTAALISQRLNQPDQSKSAFEQLLIERPKDTELRETYAEVLLALGENARAKAVLNGESK